MMMIITYMTVLRPHKTFEYQVLSFVLINTKVLL